ncbi:MAG: FCD domain-containing protein [Dermabacteraceae bacterium]|uniref:FCD domain-containing protein n=1 Tax=unclassified Brachybacterium TaxID=2623841 RepID=UPI003F90414B
MHADVSGELASRAVAIITDEQVRALSSLHYEMMAASLRDDLTTLESLNNSFHRSLNLVVDAPLLDRIVGLCSKYVPRGFYDGIEGWPEATRSEHDAIIEALQARDAEAARAAVRSHILHSGELLAEHLRAALEAQLQEETG